MLKGKKPNPKRHPSNINFISLEFALKKDFIIKNGGVIDVTKQYNLGT
mgnify:CR=1 FL=1